MPLLEHAQFLKPDAVLKATKLRSNTKKFLKQIAETTENQKNILRSKNPSDATLNQRCDI